MFAACLLAFCTGFLSLSMEILWIRLFSFANQSRPQAFAFVLAVYLIGIALGALIGKQCCRGKMNLWLVSGVVLLLSTMCNLLGPWLYASEIHHQHQLMIGGIIMMVTALLTSIVFPIAHHLGTPTTGTAVGRHVSRVYVSNILGATLGPIFTGILLLMYLSTQQSFVVCAMLTLLCAMFCLRGMFGGYVMVMSTLVLLAQFVISLTWYPHALIETVFRHVPANAPIVHVLENQHGIIIIDQDRAGDHIVTGGNVYDGTTNLDPAYNSNQINRVIIMSALVDKPERVLMIGLSIGSWLKLVTTFPGVKSIDVIEINPGYQQLMAHYPAQLSALADPRVHLYTDDGRRWLRAHPDNRYDMVVMNTTYHWRVYTANLLSREFLTLLKQHMQADAVLEFNATESPDALKTAQSVFRYAYIYENFVVAADIDWRQKLHASRARKILASLRLDGKLLYRPGSHELIARHLNLPLTSLEEIEPLLNLFGRKVEIITDRNIITEFKYGRSL